MFKSHGFIAMVNVDNHMKVTDNAGCQFEVQLSPEWYCSYGDFQETLFLCVHVAKALYVLQLPSYKYIGDYYPIAKLQTTYRVA